MSRLFQRLFIAIVAVMSVTAASAQKTGFYWGPKAGVNFTKFECESASKNTGFNLGLAMGADVSIVGFEVAALYSNEKSGDLITNFINVPVIAKIFLVGGLNVFAGPQMEFLVKEKIRVNGGVLALDSDNRTLQTTSISGVMGVGYQFIMGLNLGLSYNVGPLRYNSNGSAATSDEKFNKHNFTIVAGWRF